MACTACWRPIIFAAVLVSACSTGTPGPGIDVDRAVGHVAQLAAIGPRVGDSPQAKDAARYIASQLEVIGVPVEQLAVGGVELGDITVLGVQRRRAHHLDTTDPDLLVRFGPPGRALLIMAHYDSVPGSPGAVDNAAAVGVLLELARVLHEHPPAQPILLAFTANEERGLVGAEALVRDRASDVDFAIALDLIGASGPLTLNGASELIGRAEMRWIAGAAERAGVDVSAPIPHRVISRWWPQAERSDHGPFTRHGIRAVHFYDRGQDGERIDLAYHSPRDVPSRVDRASVDEIGRLLRALVATPPPAHAGDGFWIPATRAIVPRWLLVAFDLALALAALTALVPRRGERSRGLGVAAGIACYAAATALAAAIERLAAGAHPAPWLHAPLRGELAETAIVLGALGLVTRLLARRFAWTGDRRWRALAVALLVVPGIALVAI
ncbi:MAG: M28 family metallopeptidase, partial [Acidobacteriota bacterium]